MLVLSCPRVGGGRLRDHTAGTHHINPGSLGFVQGGARVAGGHMWVLLARCLPRPAQLAEACWRPQQLRATSAVPNTCCSDRPRRCRAMARLQAGAAIPMTCTRPAAPMGLPSWALGFTPGRALALGPNPAAPRAALCRPTIRDDAPESQESPLGSGRRLQCPAKLALPERSADAPGPLLGPSTGPWRLPVAVGRPSRRCRPLSSSCLGECSCTAALHLVAWSGPPGGLPEHVPSCRSPHGPAVWTPPPPPPPTPAPPPSSARTRRLPSPRTCRLLAPSSRPAPSLSGRRRLQAVGWQACADRSKPSSEFPRRAAAPPPPLRPGACRGCRVGGGGLGRWKAGRQPSAAQALGQEGKRRGTGAGAGVCVEWARDLRHRAGAPHRAGSWRGRSGSGRRRRWWRSSCEQRGVAGCRQQRWLPNRLLKQSAWR